MAETVVMTLTDFLLARIAEDEAVAKAATPGPWRDTPMGSEGSIVQAGGNTIRTARKPATCREFGDATHIARHDPARILAECEAKRRIVEVVGSWRHEVVEDCWYTCGAATEERDGGQCCDDLRRGTGCDCGLDFRVRSILTPLALPYAEHSDYVSATTSAPLTTNETREDT